MSKKCLKPCDHTVHALLDQVIAEHHETLREAHVSFSLIFAYAATDEEGVPTGAALTERGQPIDAKLAITSVEDRVRGLPDVKITLDGQRWDDAEEERQIATLDRLCESIFATIGKDEARTVKSDAADRPVLSRRAPDLHLTGYTAVMKRNGRWSPEAELMDELTGTMTQAELDLPGATPSTKQETRRRPGPTSTARATGKASRGAKKAGASAPTDDPAEDASEETEAEDALALDEGIVTTARVAGGSRRRPPTRDALEATAGAAT